MSIRYIALCIFTAFPLSGCGTAIFSEKKSDPIIEDRIQTYPSGYVATLGTTAERRLVLIPLVGDNAGKFCAEPSPDSIESLLAKFSADLEASAKIPEAGEGELKAEIARSLATSTAAVTKRSQGLQFYRDGIYALCQARMNGFVEAEEFKEQTYRLRDLAGELILAEIQSENWGKIQQPILITVPTGGENSSAAPDTSPGT